MPSYFKEIPTGNTNVYEGANKKASFKAKKFSLNELTLSNISSSEVVVNCYFEVTNEIDNTSEALYIIKNLAIPEGTAVSVIDKPKHITNEFSLVVQNETDGTQVECYVDYTISNSSAFVDEFKNNTLY